MLDVNKRVSDWLGYKPKEVIGKNFLQLPFLSEESQIKAKDKLSQVLVVKDVPPYELDFITKRGEKRIGRIFSNPVKNEKGEVIEILVMAFDITEGKNAEERLRVEKAYLDRLFESAQEGIVGKHLTELELLPPEDAPKYMELLYSASRGEVPKPFEVTWYHKDGTVYLAEICIGFIKERGKDMGVQVVARDMTERKRTEEKIKTSIKEREVMLREIHHRVKNNMQIISSLLRLQSRQIKNKKILDIFNVGQNRIRSMALIHESLYQSSDLAKINFSDYIDRLTNHLLSIYRVGMERIRMNADVRDVYLDINRAIPCGLIINELVSNSLKHGFPDGKKGKIGVIMNTDKRGKCTLVIKDTGVGFPKDLDFHKTETLGMQLVTDLVSQLEGRIVLKREGGTEFRIVF